MSSNFGFVGFIIDYVNTYTIILKKLSSIFTIFWKVYYLYKIIYIIFLNNGNNFFFNNFSIMKYKIKDIIIVKIT